MLWPNDETAIMKPYTDHPGLQQAGTTHSNTGGNLNRYWSSMLLPFVQNAYSFRYPSSIVCCAATVITNFGMQRSRATVAILYSVHALTIKPQNITPIIEFYCKYPSR